MLVIEMGGLSEVNETIHFKHTLKCFDGQIHQTELGPKYKEHHQNEATTE